MSKTIPIKPFVVSTSCLIALLAWPAMAQVTYDDGGIHLLDRDHGPPSGMLTDLSEGVLVDNATMLTIDGSFNPLSGDVEPIIGDTGFSFTVSDGVTLNDAIVVANRGSTVNILGGVFIGGRFNADTMVIADNAAELNITGGSFNDEAQVRSYGDSTLNLSGGSFVNSMARNTVHSFGGSTLNLSGGLFAASFDNHVTSSGASTLNLTGGTFSTLGEFSGTLVTSTGDSTLNVSGGDFTANFLNSVRSTGASTLNLTGGSFAAIRASDGNFVSSSGTSTLNLTGGSFTATNTSDGNFVSSSGDSTLTLAGGSFQGITRLTVQGDGQLNLQGGSLPDGTQLNLVSNANENPLIHILGAGFSLDGVALDFMGNATFTLFDFDGTNDTVGLLDGGDVLTGTLLDGSPFSWVVDVSGVNASGSGSGGQIILLIPEPATMTMLALGGLALLRRRQAPNATL